MDAHIIPTDAIEVTGIGADPPDPGHGRRGADNRPELQEIQDHDGEQPLNMKGVKNAMRPGLRCTCGPAEQRARRGGQHDPDSRPAGRHPRDRARPIRTFVGG